MIFKLCRHIVDILKMCMWNLDGASLILTELQPFKLSHFGSFFYTLGYGICVISSCQSFQLMFLKFCRHIVDMLKMCMWGFDGIRIKV